MVKSRPVVCVYKCFWVEFQQHVSEFLHAVLPEEGSFFIRLSMLDNQEAEKNGLHGNLLIIISQSFYVVKYFSAVCDSRLLAFTLLLHWEFKDKFLVVVVSESLIEFSYPAVTLHRVDKIVWNFIEKCLSYFALREYQQRLFFIFLLTERKTFIKVVDYRGKVESECCGNQKFCDWDET